MSQRPTFIDFGSNHHNTNSDTPSSSGLPSPRITYFDGEIPPAMSPLDAFAVQSRLLAKQLDDSQKESQKHGRRVSRLPPITIAKSLAKPRPGYFRSKSALEEVIAHNENPPLPCNEPSGNRTELEEPTFRPKSHYPRLSEVPAVQDDTDSPDPSATGQPFMTPFEYQPSPADDYFGSLRAQTPDHFTSNSQQDETPLAIQASRNLSSLHRWTNSQQDLSVEIPTSRGRQPSSLVPPDSHSARRAPSVKSIPVDSSEDEKTVSTVGSSVSQQRKFSESSSVSISQSPASPYVASHARSESLNSEYSLGGSRFSRAPLNFSRPLSRGGRPSIEVSRQASSDSQPYAFSTDGLQTPLSTENDEFFDTKEHQAQPAPSYIYTKFSLPRGRMMQRNPITTVDTGTSQQHEAETPSAQMILSPATPVEQSSLPTPPHSIDSVDLRPQSPGRLSVEQEEPSQSLPSSTRISNIQHRQSLASTNSGSTIKAQSPRKAAPSTYVTAEDHLSKGIDCHERGSLKESTYHLRIAARQNHPTAMLLYALACRHGWGMRPNQSEGVQWLRKAMDSASIELGDDATTNANGGSPVDISERKTRRAQFALSVYELGVSHMNGWGIEQDKGLALKCFEIAANWGDADAMAEAGFCYTQGVGCKKDLRKAARFYRMAEAKGMSMVGNSWYVFILSLSSFFFLFFFVLVWWLSTREVLRLTSVVFSPMQDLQTKIRRGS